MALYPIVPYALADFTLWASQHSWRSAGYIASHEAGAWALQKNNFFVRVESKES